MATYSAAHYIEYTPNSGTTYDMGGALPGGGVFVYDDAEPDTTFEVGDDVNPNAITATYMGTVNVPVVAGGSFDLMILEMSSVPGSQVLILPEGSDPADFNLPASIDTATLNMVPFTTCFAKATMISTPSGARAVEDLSIGDNILTADGHCVSVKWIARQTITKFFHRTRAQLVRIRAHALGDGLPHSDLSVTGEHGMIIDGLVINASALVNGGSIDWVPMNEVDDRFTVYHIETEDHDVILANGTPAETYVDAVTRCHFDNYQEYLDLYGSDRTIPEMNRLRISAQRLVPDAIKMRLGITDQVSGFGDLKTSFA